MLKKGMELLKGKNTPFQTMVFIASVILLFLIIIYQSVGTIQLRQEISALEQKVVESQNQNKLLVEEVQSTSTEKYVEKVAREKLNMVKSKEVPVKVEEVVVEEKKEQKDELNKNDKIGLYLSEWYKKLEKWYENNKTKSG